MGPAAQGRGAGPGARRGRRNGAGAGTAQDCRVGAQDRPAAVGSGFFQASLAAHRGGTASEQRRWRNSIFANIEAMTLPQGQSWDTIPIDSRLWLRRRFGTRHSQNDTARPKNLTTEPSKKRQKRAVNTPGIWFRPQPQSHHALTSKKNLTYLPCPTCYSLKRINQQSPATQPGFSINQNVNIYLYTPETNPFALNILAMKYGGEGDGPKCRPDPDRQPCAAA